LLTVKTIVLMLINGLRNVFERRWQKNSVQAQLWGKLLVFPHLAKACP